MFLQSLSPNPNKLLSHTNSHCFLTRLQQRGREENQYNHRLSPSPRLQHEPATSSADVEVQTREDFLLRLRMPHEVLDTILLVEMLAMPLVESSHRSSLAGNNSARVRSSQSVLGLSTTSVEQTRKPSFARREDIFDLWVFNLGVFANSFKHSITHIFRPHLKTGLSPTSHSFRASQY